MNIIPSGDKTNKYSQPAPKEQKKTNAKVLSSITSAHLERSSSDPSLKMERSFKASSSEEEAPEKRSKREKLKGIGRKILSPITKLREGSKICSDCSTALDTSYQSDIDGNDDIAFTDKDLGFIYVVDGAQHNDALMKRDLEAVFSSFNAAYQEGSKKLKFSSVEEAQEHVCKYMNGLHNMIRQMANDVNAKVKAGEENPVGISFTSEAGGTYDFEAGKLPALSFGQLVKIKGETYLLSAQYGDTSFVIQRNGTLDFSLVDTDHDTPLGQKQIKADDVRATQLQSGDRIIACSDGIMEFITESEFQKIALKKPQAEAPELLSAFKAKVLRNGEEFRALSKGDREKHLESTSTRNKMAILGANKRVLKTHTPGDRKLTDDLSLALMTVN